MFAQRSRKYLIDSATLIAGLEGKEGSAESVCLDILWMLLESNQIEVLILADEWNSLSSHIHKKIKEPKRAEELLNRIRENIKPIHSDKDERIKLLYFVNEFQTNNQDIVSIEQVISQHTTANYNGTNAIIESLVFLFSIWLTKEVLGVQIDELDTFIDGIGSFLGARHQKSQTFPKQPTGFVWENDVYLGAGTIPQDASHPLDQPYQHGEGLTPQNLVLLHGRWFQQLRGSLTSMYNVAQATQALHRRLLSNQDMRSTLTQTILDTQTITSLGVAEDGEDTVNNDAAPADSNDGSSSRSPNFTDQNDVSEEVVETPMPDGEVVASPIANDDSNIEESDAIIDDIFIQSLMSAFELHRHPEGDYDVVDGPPVETPMDVPSPILKEELGFPDEAVDPMPVAWIHTYTYDAQHQLNSLLLDTNDDGVVDWINLYTYDDVGNLTKQFSDIQGDGKIDHIGFIEDNTLVAFLADTNNDSIFDLAISDVTISRVSFDAASLDHVMAEINTDLLILSERLEHQWMQAQISVSDASINITSSRNPSQGDRDFLLQGGQTVASQSHPHSSKPTALTVTEAVIHLQPLLPLTQPILLSHLMNRTTVDALSPTLDDAPHYGSTFVSSPNDSSLTIPSV